MGNIGLVSPDAKIFIKWVALVKRLKKAEALLWRGNVETAKALFALKPGKKAYNFCAYLNQHRERIINYE